MAYIQSRVRRGRKRYVVRWRDPGGLEQSASFDKRGRYDIPGTAEHFKHGIDEKLGSGTYIDPDLGKVSLGIQVAKWAERGRTETTRHQRRNFAKNLGELAGMPIGQVRPPDVRDWLDALARGRPWCGGRPLGENSVALHLQFLKTVFNIAVDDGVVAINPARRISAPRPDTAKSTVELLTVEQVRALVDNAPPQLACMIIVSASTGLRPSETAGLRVCDIDFLRREIHVVQQASPSPSTPPTARLKTPSSKRTVPLPTEALTSLTTFLAGVERKRHELVFRTSKGNTWSADSMVDRFHAVAARAGVPASFTWHDLRHFYASALIQHGASVKTVQQRLGHSSPDTTLRVYTHLWPGQDEHTRAAIDTALTVHDSEPVLFRKRDRNGTRHSA